MIIKQEYVFVILISMVKIVQIFFAQIIVRAMVSVIVKQDNVYVMQIILV